MKLKYVIYTAFVVGFLMGCKRGEEGLRWNVDATLPLFYGELGIDDLLSDSLIVANPDSSLLLKYAGPLVDIDFDEILMIPDTIIKDTFEAPFPIPINVDPGQVFINMPDEQKFDLNGVYLKSVKLHQGLLNYEISSSIEGVVIYTYDIPNALDKDGVSFSKQVTIPTSNGATVVKSGSFSLEGYTLDMTGQSGYDHNAILTNVNCKISENNSAAVSVSSADKIIISNQISDVVIQEAVGYFGQHKISTGLDSTTVEGLSKWLDGTLDLGNVAVQIAIKNGVGVDLIAKLNQVITRKNPKTVYLQHNVLGDQVTMARAIRYGDSIVPSVFEIDFNNQNSNIDNAIEILPNELLYDLDLEVNPLGNISGYNDFYLRNAPLGLFLDVEIPLELSTEDLVLQDTVIIDLQGNNALNNLNMYLEIENGYPLAANLEIGILDANDKLVDRVFSPNDIPAGVLGTDGKVSTSVMSDHTITLSPKNLERLMLNGKIVITLRLNTAGQQRVILYSDYTMKYNIKADANISISINQ